MKAHYVLSRPFANFPAHMMPYSLTAGSLRKPGMLCVPPVVVSKTRHGAEVLGGHRGDAYAFVHLGRNLCGHDGIVHGGLLATVLDETLARTSFFHLPHKIGVTAHLEIDYKKPVKADSVVVVETKLIEHEGRKAWVEATMTDLRGQVLVQSKALFVEPRLVAFLDTSAVRKVMDQSDE
ncbi:Thioesterase/thiol ester dehydrase-isomerase [Meira miltonrushii]|uniref:Thioesterase/thiol ester dehydrase-isomerase n=1 Tax=Meira miltonrushii TaxID=1280837 RepID=A0A316VHQ6_9BASI|nr:Thioesterase/thiol ester dehydrase-isomerase [Meira miltonrushii]PWN37060.1 Thioesterase/thiol ester dehydrase-isomerase [Meira miltonrushii]